MQLLQLKYFLTIAELNNISRAAEELYVSQPSLSRSISRLEEDLGFELFIRTKNTVKLSPAGKAYYEYVKKALELLECGILEARKLSHTADSTITVETSLAANLLLVREYNDSLNLEQVKLTVTDNAAIRNDLLSSKTQFGICIGHLSSELLTHIPLMESPFYLAVNRRGAFAGIESVTLRETLSENLFCSSMGNTVTMLNKIYSAAGLTPHIIPLDGKDILFDAVEKGLGCVLALPLCGIRKRYYKNPEDDPIKFIPVTDIKTSHTIHLIMRKDAELTDRQHAFIDFIKNEYAAMTDGLKA